VLRSADRLARETRTRNNEDEEQGRGTNEKTRTTAEESRRRGRMDRAEIETRVKKVLAEQLAVDEQQVVPDARFAEDLNADSLDLVEAVLALEEEWSIEIPEDEMESVKTVGQAVDLVASKLGMS
jgi:acyl carrier protein